MKCRIGFGALAPIILFMLAGPAAAVCRDAVVLVHGNTGKPSDFDNTYVELRARGYAAGEIFRPSWGSKTCAACNDHRGSEETPVLNAMVNALAASCTGKIDVIGHSMGATLAAKQIADNGLRPSVQTFVGIAGAFRGLWSCGVYPFNVATSTCGAWGLSVSNPFLGGLSGKRFGDEVYSFKSWTDQIVCATGVCTVGGIHSSSIWGENGSLTFATGHFGLLSNTAVQQADIIQ